MFGPCASIHGRDRGRALIRSFMRLHTAEYELKPHSHVASNIGMVSLLRINFRMQILALD